MVDAQRLRVEQRPAPGGVPGERPLADARQSRIPAAELGDGRLGQLRCRRGRLVCASRPPARRRPRAEQPPRGRAALRNGRSPAAAAIVATRTRNPAWSRNRGRLLESTVLFDLRRGTAYRRLRLVRLRALGAAITCVLLGLGVTQVGIATEGIRLVVVVVGIGLDDRPADVGLRLERGAGGTRGSPAAPSARQMDSSISETSTHPPATSTTITRVRRSAIPAPTPSRIRKPASSANLGANPPGIPGV